MSDSLWPHELQHARLLCPSQSAGDCSNSSLLSWWCCLTSPSSVTSSSFCLQCFQASGSFSWVNSSHQEVLELQLQHQSFQWMFRIDFLYDWLVWSPCSSGGSQELFFFITIQIRKVLFLQCFCSVLSLLFENLYFLKRLKIAVFIFFKHFVLYWIIAD